MMKHKHAVNQKEHKHAELLRMAADNADQLFEYGGLNYYEIHEVLNSPDKNWRPVKKTKKIKRWLWSNDKGYLTGNLHTEEEIKKYESYTIKLLWSETEFEVSDDS